MHFKKKHPQSRVDSRYMFRDPSLIFKPLKHDIPYSLSLACSVCQNEMAKNTRYWCFLLDQVEFWIFSLEAYLCTPTALNFV